MGFPEHADAILNWTELNTAFVPCYGLTAGEAEGFNTLSGARKKKDGERWGGGEWGGTDQSLILAEAVIVACFAAPCPFDKQLTEALTHPHREFSEQTESLHMRETARRVSRVVLGKSSPCTEQKAGSAVDESLVVWKVQPLHRTKGRISCRWIINRAQRGKSNPRNAASTHLLQGILLFLFLSLFSGRAQKGKSNQLVCSCH